MAPSLRELIALTLLAGLGCGLALARGDLLFVAVFWGCHRNDYRDDTTFSVKVPRAIRALPDLCLGIGSGRPVSSHPFEPSAATALIGWSPALLRMLFFKGR